MERGNYKLNQEGSLTAALSDEEREAEMTEDEKMRRLADLREKAILDEKAIRRKGYEDGHEAGYEDGRTEGLAEGLAEGKAEGKAEERKAILNNLKKMELSTEEICKILNISKEELEKME